MGPLSPLTVIWDGGSPTADGAVLSRLCTATGQRDGLDELVEAGGWGQTDHGEAVDGWARWAVRAVSDYVGNIDVLLCALLQSNVVLPKRRNGAVGSAWRRGKKDSDLLSTFQASGRSRPMTEEQWALIRHKQQVNQCDLTKVTAQNFYLLLIPVTPMDKRWWWSNKLNFCLAHVGGKSALLDAPMEDRTW